MTGKKTKYGLAALISGLILMTGTLCSAQDLAALFAQVENLKIEHQGYILGGRLTQAQQEIAAKNPLDSGSPKVFKFQDQELNVVADKASNRVLVMYKRFEQVSRQKAQDLIGELFMAYEEPTVFAHDQVVYWAWGAKGKFTSAEFDAAKEQQKQLAIIATVKLNSDIKIMEKTELEALGDLYYIISSDPLLQFFHDT